MPELQVVSLGNRATRGWPYTTARLDPVVLLHISALGLILANVGRIPAIDLGARQAPILVGDITAAAAVSIALMGSMAVRSLRLDQVALAALLFAGIGALSALASAARYGLTGFEVMASLAYLARWLLYFGIYLLVVNHVRPRHVRGVWSTLETALLLIAAFGIIQSIFLPNFALIVYPDQAEHWDAQRHRLVSTILDPNIAAAVILTVLLVQIAQLAFGVRLPLWKPTLLLVALVMTLSRSGMLGLFVGGVTILLASRRLSRRMLRFGAIALAGFVVALPRLLDFASDYNRIAITDASAAARLVTWQRALATLWEHPWFGIGFNTYGFVQEHRGFDRVSGSSYSAEGGLLFIAVMTGVVGLGVFVAMLWLVFRRCRAGWRDERATPEERGLCAGAAAATVAICVHSVFVNSLLVPFVMQPLWILWGLVYVMRIRMRSAAIGVT